MRSKRVQTYRQAFANSIVDNEKRYYLQFVDICLILAAVSAVMSLVNIFTGNWVLLCSTAAFALLCLLNIYLLGHIRSGKIISALLFCTEIVLLMVFFVVSGRPQGFSITWACLIPPTALLLFQRRRGALLCAAVFAVLVFFLDTPLGNGMLQYAYTDAFRLRFPLLYLAFFALAYFLETVRAITHDALTHVLNRYGFNALMDTLLRNPTAGIALIILDIDHFKDVNDTYGHPAGDAVLKRLAEILSEQAQGRARVCRWGGEEFALLRPVNTPGPQLAEQLRAAVERATFMAAGRRLHVTISLGVVSAPRGTYVEAADLVYQTDTCLYRAKKQGRNQVVQADYQLDQAATQKRRAPHGRAAQTKQ